MIFGSVCSGIEAASVAWEPLGWRAAFVAEIDPFPCAVLAHRYPGVPNRGDFTTIAGDAGPIDVLVGGTPCQSFSVAGLRGGMADARGNLALEFLRFADRLRPLWVVWENVPGVLSSNGGRDFGAFLGGLAELGYGWAYRVLDAQYFGVPQRRRRVFVVGHSGDPRRAAAVLFERHCLSGDPPPGRASGADVAGSLGGGSGERGWCDDLDRSGAFVARPLLRHGQRSDLETETFIAYTLRADGSNVGPMGTIRSGNGSTTGGVPFVVNAAESGAKASHARPSETARCLDSTGSFATAQGGTVALQQAGVRRLTPLECEWLMGFTDGWTLVPYRGKPASDGPRYKALGNSMAVPVVRWIGRRIALVNRI